MSRSKNNSGGPDDHLTVYFKKETEQIERHFRSIADKPNNKQLTGEQILEKAEKRYFQDRALEFIAQHPKGPWPQDTVLDVICESVGESWFFRAIARAIEKGHDPMVSKLELEIVKRWRKVEIEGKLLPGLASWNSEPSAELIFFLTGHKKLNAEGYRQITRRLGLKREKRLISSFVIERYGGNSAKVKAFHITIRGVTEKIFPVSR